MTGVLIRGVVALAGLALVAPTLLAANPMLVPQRNPFVEPEIVPGSEVQFRADSPIRRLGYELEIGEPYHHRNLTIFPLLLDALERPDDDIITLDRAIDQGLVEVREKDRAEVNAVQMRNRGRRSVFGLSGEMIVGAQQDRMLQHDVLLPPNSGWMTVEVYCTESGRWHGKSDRFGSIQRIVPNALRSRAAQTRSQSEVWTGVERAKSALGDATPGTALQSVYNNRDVSERARPYIDRLQQLPGRSPRVVGAVVAVGRRIIVMDVFTSHRLFEAMWDKLLRSYVMDALCDEDEGILPCGPARALVSSLQHAAADRRPNPGAGTAWRIETGAGTGAALVSGDRVVHLDLFPNGDPLPGLRGPEERTPSLDHRRPKR